MGRVKVFFARVSKHHHLMSLAFAMLFLIGGNCPLC